MKRTKDLPESRRVYQSTIEITDLQSGSSRRIPLKACQVISLSRKKGVDNPPPYEVLQFQDGDFQIEARSFEEFRDRLRDQYPDERYERRLHMQRDREAEERRERGFQGLIELLAEAAVKEILAEAAGEGDAPAGLVPPGDAGGLADKSRRDQRLEPPQANPKGARARKARVRVE